MCICILDISSTDSHLPVIAKIITKDFIFIDFTAITVDGREILHLLLFCLLTMMLIRTVK